MPKETPWFRHDMNARRDQNMVSLRYVYGVEGIGRFWILIEILREQTDYQLQLTKWTIGMLSDEWGCKKEEAEAFLNSLINDFKLCKKSDTCIYSESLCRRMKSLDEKRKALSEAGLRGYQARIAKSESQAQAALTETLSNEKKEKKEKKEGMQSPSSATPHPSRNVRESSWGDPMIVDILQIHKKATGADLVISEAEMTDLLALFRKYDGPSVVAAYRIHQKERPGHVFRFFLQDFAEYHAKAEKQKANHYQPEPLYRERTPEDDLAVDLAAAKLRQEHKEKLTDRDREVLELGPPKEAPALATFPEDV